MWRSRVCARPVIVTPACPPLEASRSFWRARESVGDRPDYRDCRGLSLGKETDIRSWYHTIDFPDGTSSPGYFDTRGAPQHIEWPSGLQGGRCLDVGTFDGFWAFEMERRGAGSVVALDIEDMSALDWRYDEMEAGPKAIQAWGAERGPGFHEAHRRRGSNVERLVLSVYDLDPERHGMFDVVFCGALLLHLRDPIAALERMRSVCRGELVLVETLDPALDMVARRIPCVRLSQVRDQWWKANKYGLLSMVKVAGFRLTWIGRRFITPYGAGVNHPTRYTLTGVAAGKPRSKGELMLPLRAAPRERRPTF